MHTASYEFLIKPEESAGCHQTLSARVGSGDETTAVSILPSLVPRPSPAPVFDALRDGLTWFSDGELSWNRSTLLLTSTGTIPGNSRHGKPNEHYILSRAERISCLGGETLLEATDAWRLKFSCDIGECYKDTKSCMVTISNDYSQNSE